MVSKPVGWFELYVQDPARAKAFYERVFGIELTPLDSPDSGPPMWAFPGSMDDGPGSSGALVQMNADQRPGVGGTMIYFGCEDCAVQARLAVECGGRLVQNKQSIGPYGHYAAVEDSEGNRIGLHSMQ